MCSTPLRAGFLLLLSWTAGAEAQDATPTTVGVPRRRPGVWRITTISPEIGMQRADVCIEEGDSIIGPRARDCAPPSVSRVEDQVIITIECGAGERREVESLLFTGDFTGWYRAQSRTTSGARRSGVTIDARFLRPICAPD
jgi:hypothetical protein